MSIENLMKMSIGILKLNVINESLIEKNKMYLGGPFGIELFQPGSVLLSRCCLGGFLSLLGGLNFFILLILPLLHSWGHRVISVDLEKNK